VYERIRQLPHPAKDSYFLSGSLTETSIEFIKKQSPFAHNLIRLAKFWNKTIFIQEYISGRSTLIELIAIYAANKEEKYDRQSILRGFKSFLVLMKDFKTLNIVFEMFYKRNEVETYVSSQSPLILDPSNPHNNFAHDITENVINKFKEFAETSIKRLEEAYSRIPINLN